jgi:hypothetical protein
MYTVNKVRLCFLLSNSVQNASLLSGFFNFKSTKQASILYTVKNQIIIFLISYSVQMLACLVDFSTFRSTPPKYLNSFKLLYFLFLTVYKCLLA